MVSPNMTPARWDLPELPSPSIGDVPSVDGQLMVEADRIATDRIGFSLLQMMENAGHQLAELTRLTLGSSVAGRCVVVLAGTGNNAGGGLVAARRLAGWGADVCVAFAHPILRLRPAPCAQVEPLLAAGVRAAVAGHDRTHDELRGEIEHADVVLDTLIGYSLRGAPDEVLRPLIEMARAGAGAVLSLDIPSGIDATTGARPGAAVSADATLALALPKRGLSIGKGARHAGVPYLADIGIPASVFTGLGVAVDGIFDAGPLVRIG